jgi:hypothetical protein
MIGLLILDLSTFNGDYTAIVLTSIGFLIEVIAFIYSPLRYKISNEYLTIVRPIKSIRIKLEDIVSISIPDDNIIKKSGRTGGVGGLFGFYGKFYNKDIGGDMTVYATQLRNFVLIKVNDKLNRYSGPSRMIIKSIVISPDMNFDFTDELKNKTNIIASR